MPSIFERLSIHARRVAELIRKHQSGAILSSKEESWIERVCSASEPESIQSKDQPVLQMPVFDSMQQCAASTGVPLGRLKSAKRSGCGAFRSNRVYSAELLVWFANPDASAETIDFLFEKAREAKARADLLEMKRSRGEKETVHIEEAEAMIRSALQPVRELLLSAPSTLAARCNPTDPTIARAAVTAWVDEGLRVCRGEALGESVNPRRKK